MSSHTIKEKLLNLFKNDKTKQIFSILDETLLSESGLYQEYINLRRRYNQLKDLSMSGTLDFSDYLQESNRLGQVLLQLINDLESGDLIELKKEIDPAIYNPILVVTDSIDAKNFLDKFFKETNFRQVEVILDKDPIPSAQFDLMIFDNRSLRACPSLKALSEMDLESKIRIEHRINLMESYMKQKSGFLIHFGEYFFWINQNRERIHAANSQFSLFARTKEVIEFMKAYRV